MTCLRCNRDVSTLDGHCTPCRRHLGMEPRKMPRPITPKKQNRTRGNGRTHGSAANPSRRQVREAYEAAIVAGDVLDTGPRQPSLPRVEWLERPMPRIFP